MADPNPILIVNTGDGERRVDLWSYLDADASERAERDANAWIKSLRHVAVDGVPLRNRFLFRGDSLWWFAELYLHKRRVVVTILRTLLALEALAARERPLTLGLAAGDAATTSLARQFAARPADPLAGTVTAASRRVAQADRARVARRTAPGERGARAPQGRPAPARSGGAGRRRGVRALGVLEAGDRRRVVHRPGPARGVAAGRQSRPGAGGHRHAHDVQAAQACRALPGVVRRTRPPPFRSARRAATRHGTRSCRQPASGGIGTPIAGRCTGARRSARRASSGAATRGRCSATSSPASPICSSRGRPARWTRLARRSTR